MKIFKRLFKRDKKEKRFVVTVLKADGRTDLQGDALKMDAVEFNHEVSVSLDYNLKEDLLGMAKLKKEGNQVIADIKINKKELKKYSKVDFKNLYPAIAGIVKKKSSDGEINKVEICSIGLCTSPNVDSRIKTIGEQENDRLGKIG